MNVKHVNSNIWSKLGLTSYAVSVVLGIFGNSRTKFSNDFTYNVMTLLSN
jgi:hypothetical protein